jgi:hypothetical protein
VCRVAGAPVMPRTARPQSMGGVSPTTSPLTCHAVMSGTTFRVRGEPGSHGTNPGKFLAPHSPSPTPSTFSSSRWGPASSRAMQCSRVEQESRSSRRLDWDDRQTATGTWNEGSSFHFGTRQHHALLIVGLVVVVKQRPLPSL